MKTKSGEKVNIKYNFREYLSYIKNYKFLVFILIFVILLHEIKQVAEKFLFKAVVDNGTEFVSGSLSHNAFIQLLITVGAVYVGLNLSTVFINWGKFFFLNKLDAATIYDLKKKYFSHILGLDYSFHTTHKTGSLISRIGRGAGAMERMNGTLIFEFAPLVLQLIVATLAFVYLDFLSAIIIAITFSVMILFSYVMQKKSEPSNIFMNRREDIEKGNVADFLTNIDSIRNYGKESYIKSKFFSLISKTKKSQLNHWNRYNFISAGQSLIIGIGTFLLIYFSVVKLLRGEITLGTITFIYTTYFSLMGPLFGFVHGIRNFSKSMADFQELFQYGKFENEIRNKPGAKKLVIKEGRVDFRNIFFNYGKRKIFENFDLKINTNEKVALVGHSGSGKTTLIKLLYRLYDVNFGGVFIDGRNIKDFKQESLRSELSIVPQECVLFDDTIFNNIKFSKPDALKEEVLRAIKFAQLDRVIKNFPRKEDTIVGERGVRLSGGEKQRVSIARAILADKKILVLDEATSSLDSETEHDIQEDLEKLLEGRTAIMIAHRLSTIMKADKIVVMKKGRITQVGSHQELIRQEGEYKRLWNLQKGGYIK
jgi:ATP-binding cassette subfamily B protein